jgi:hypothetical protein
MAVTAGRDYAFSPHLRTVLKGAGHSRACGLITRRAVYLIPFVSISGGGVTITRTTVTIGGKTPGEYVGQLLADPQMTPEALDAAVGAQCAGIASARALPLEQFRRIKIRSGFFSRGVLLTTRAEGMWGNPLTDSVGWRPAKDEVPVFAAFFAGDPRLV